MKPRTAETDHGIQGELDVTVYDRMHRRIRDKGWIETRGLTLEIGPRPGYLGLEWLKHTSGTTLRGLKISAGMIQVALRNTEEYGLSDRIEFMRGSGENIPLDDGYSRKRKSLQVKAEWEKREKNWESKSSSC